LEVGLPHHTRTLSGLHDKLAFGRRPLRENRALRLPPARARVTAQARPIPRAAQLTSAIRPATSKVGEALEAGAWDARDELLGELK
jgi:hypothetical protein